jgi:hypothetical protein
MTERSAPSTLRRRLSVPIHPFLFTAYAVLFLWSQNVGKVVPSEVVVPLFASLALTTVVFVIARLVLRRVGAAAMLATAASVLFFSYGHVFDVMNGRSILGVKIGETKLLALWVLLAIAAVIVVVRWKTTWAGLSYMLNVVLGVLIVMSAVTIVTGTLREGGGTPVARRSDDTSAKDTPERKPDIYYFILDRYAGASSLQKFYGFDNSEFIDELRERGFFIADKARGNYPKTPHSLATSMNMEYLDDLPESSSDWRKVYSLLPSNRVIRFVKDRGYEYVYVTSKYHALQDEPLADHQYTYRSGSPVWSGFGQTLMESTLLAAVGTRLNVTALDDRRQDYERTLFQFEQIPKAKDIAGPTYTFAHLYVGHDPYVFDAEGNYVSEQAARGVHFREAYIEQLKYGNERLLELVDELLDVPEDEKPVILLQADEGPGPVGWNPNTPEHYDWTKAPQETLEEKFGLFVAFHAPGMEDELYPSISPVNNFRAIFDHYLNADLGLLPDRSFVFRNELEPYRFVDVTERVKD